MNNSQIHWNLAVDHSFNQQKWQQIRATIFATIRVITKDCLLTMTYSDKLVEFNGLINALNRNDDCTPFLLDECNRFMSELDLKNLTEESQALTEAISIIKLYKDSQEVSIINYLRENNHCSLIIEIYGDYIILAQNEIDLKEKRLLINRGMYLGFYSKESILQLIKTTK